jgi:hypothetical protein
LRPADTGVFGHPSRTGLLRALEGLSWNPVTLPRAASILARLAQVEIQDNWVNKPTHSLKSIFRAWMPQTCEPVRDVMEDIQSEPMMRGAHSGVYNSRGVHWRGEGGAQERQLAEKYRKWGQALQVSHPFVAAKLLTGLAQTYDHDASREDTEAGIRRRLR